MKREAALHSVLEHDNILKLFAVFSQGPYVVLIEEVAEGGDLYHVLKVRHKGRRTSVSPGWAGRKRERVQVPRLYRLHCTVRLAVCGRGQRVHDRLQVPKYLSPPCY